MIGSSTKEPESQLRTPSMKVRTKGFLGEIIDRIRDLKLHATQAQTNDTKEIGPRRCIPCDSVEHLRRYCTSFQEALQNNKVFLKEGRIHSMETCLPFVLN